MFHICSFLSTIIVKTYKNDTMAVAINIHNALFCTVYDKCKTDTRIYFKP